MEEYPVLGYDHQNAYPTFKLFQITAHTTHPIRKCSESPRRSLVIAGNHKLYHYGENRSLYYDEDGRPLQPNIFGYKFGSSIAYSGTLHVTLGPDKIWPVNEEAILIGTVDGKEIIKSNYFFFGRESLTVEARVIDPNTSDGPLVLDVVVQWGMRLKTSSQNILPIGPASTRLELYWIAETLHPAFKGGIPLDFLRFFVEPDSPRKSHFLAYVTERIFKDLHKRYDTITGTSHFGMNLEGGNFALERYLRKRYPHEEVGTAFDVVNCYDQAGIVELAGSLTRETGWLYLQPFGYIKPTRLVGVDEWQVNNPFFKKTNPPSAAMVDQNDAHRTSFGTHAFNGLFRTLDNNPVFDACSGPHLGTESIAQYRENSIDNVHPGLPTTYKDVKLGDGVQGINAPHLSRYPEGSEYAEPLAERGYDALDTTPSIVAYLDWARLDTWLKPTLGDTWDVQYKEVSVGADFGTQIFWLISDANAPDDEIRVTVDALSVIAADGNLDMAASEIRAVELVADLRQSTQLEDAWRSGRLPGIGAYFQYKDHVAAGRIVIVVRNLVIDIAGMASTKALHPVALKLINRYTPARFPDRSMNPTLQMLEVSSHIILNILDDHSSRVTLYITDKRFSVVFSAGRHVVSATVVCDGDGVLFDRYEIDEGGYEVEFFLIPYKVGTHHVRVSVADSETMFRASYNLEVEVLFREVVGPWI